jgi:hypothetical protein
MRRRTNVAKPTHLLAPVYGWFTAALGNRRRPITEAGGTMSERL